MGKHFSDEVLRAIRDRVDLVELVGAYVTLKRAGQNAVGLCPFHAEKRPSFTVSASKQLFHCFGCGAGGDLFGFVMQRESMGFSEAVQFLARKAGVALPDRDIAGDRRRAVLYDIHRAAAEHYRQRLSGRDGESARRYLRGRGLAPDTIEAFGFGYALSSWDDALTALSAKGWTPAELEEAGLIAPRTQGGGWYDRFRHRVICPITDVHQNVVAFGGRLLDEHPSQPKYLNSPETPLFSKGRHLFALDRARSALETAGTLVVVEGYFDVISAHQAGFSHVVATLGTALTPAHLELIRRLVQRVILVFDPDAAGVRAAMRTIDVFGSSDVRIDVATLPGGKDPDRLITEDGPEAFRCALETSRRLPAFILDQLVPPSDYRAVDDKKAAAARALPVIAKLANAIEQDYYRAWLADRIGVAEASLREGRGTSAPNRTSRRAERVTERSPERPRAEMVLVAALMQGRLGLGRIRALGPEVFSDPSLRRLVTLLCSAATAAWPPDPDPALVQRLWPLVEDDDALVRMVSEVSVSALSEEEAEKEVDDCERTLAQKPLKTRERELARMIDQYEAAGEYDRVTEAQRELDRLKKAGIEPKNAASESTAVGS